jgi:hypothetical protein
MVYTKRITPPPQIRHPRKPLAPAPTSRPRDRVSTSPNLFGKRKAEAPDIEILSILGWGDTQMCQGLTGAAWGYQELHLSCALYGRRFVASLWLLRAFDHMHKQVRLWDQSHVPGLPVRRQDVWCLAGCQDIGIFRLRRWTLSPPHSLFLCIIGSVRRVYLEPPSVPMNGSVKVAHSLAVSIEGIVVSCLMSGDLLYGRVE